MNLRSRRVAVAVAVGVAVADVVLLNPWSASAQAPAATGSWQVLRQSSPLGALPSTTTSGSRDLPVHNSPVGVLAFSALRYVAPGATAGVLTLSLSGQQPTDPPAVDLCPVTSSWAAGPDQPWSARPAYDCAHAAVVGAGNPSQMTWAIGPDLLVSGRLDVALVPDPADRTPYAVTFAAPDADSFDPVEGATVKSLPSAGRAPGASASTSTAPQRAGTGAPAAVPALGSTSVQPDDAGQPPAVAPTGTPASSAQRVAARGPASRALGAAALAAFALILLLRSFVSVGTKGRTPRSLIPTPPGGA